MGVVRALNAEEVKAIFGSTLESECFLPLIMPVSQKNPHIHRHYQRNYYEKTREFPGSFSVEA